MGILKGMDVSGVFVSKIYILLIVLLVSMKKGWTRLMYLKFFAEASTTAPHNVQGI